MQRKLPGAEAREGFPPEHAVRPLGLEGMQRGEAGKGSLLLLLHGAAPGPTPTFSRVYVARSMISGKCSSYSRMTSFSMSAGGEGGQSTGAEQQPQSYSLSVSPAEGSTLRTPHRANGVIGQA